MDFNLSKEQELLRDGLDRFLSTRYDLEKSRAAAKTGAGWQPDIWRGFADELGILGAALPEDVGGIGGGPVEVMVIAEALGHALGGGTVRRHGRGGRWPAAAGGRPRGGGAAGEGGGRYRDRGVGGGGARSPVSSGRTCRRSPNRDGDEWVLRGSKIVAMSAPIATHLLITARTSSGLSLFVAETDSTPTGIEIHSYRTVDDRRAADLVFDGLRLPASALLGQEGQAWPSLAKARDEGAAAICSEAVGCMRKVLADTVEYCKQRQQFGQPIGSFQVLQHRMVDMYMELEQAVAAVYLAVLNLEAEPDSRARAVSAAKATIGRAARFIGQQAVQLHGGMGMTEELAIGHYFKRLTALQFEFGSTDYHVARYAELTKS